MTTISRDPSSREAPAAARRSASLPRLLSGLRWYHLALAILLVVYPLVMPGFWIRSIGSEVLILGLIALSLMFLAGYGGMVSLAQLTVAGLAGYLIAILGGAANGLGLFWPWWVALPVALAAAALFAAFVGWISVRTEGIYTIMITLAISVAFYYLVLQNEPIFNAFDGFAGLRPPHFLGVEWGRPVPFYYLCLAVAGAAYCFVLYLSRAPFGLSLQAVRDNPRRMRALGFDVRAHRIAAHALAGLLAACGGVLLVWQNTQISPGSVNIGPVIGILIIAVLGGLRHPIGPFIGALLYVMLQNFAIDVIDRERFNTVIGAAFLLIVLFSPDGVLGLVDRLRRRLAKSSARTKAER